MDGITTSHPQFSVYHPKDESSKLQTVNNTQKLASDLYINKILNFLARNLGDNSISTSSNIDKLMPLK